MQVEPAEEEKDKHKKKSIPTDRSLLDRSDPYRSICLDKSDPYGSICSILDRCFHRIGAPWIGWAIG